MGQAERVTRDESTAVLRPEPGEAKARTDGAASARPGPALLPSVTGSR